jgi:hypothetical protein
MEHVDGNDLKPAASTESHLKDFSAFFRRAEKAILSITKGYSQ